MIRQHLIHVVRNIFLALGCINPQLFKHTLHTKGSCLVRNDRNDAMSNSFVLGEGRQHTNKRHGRGNLPVTRSFQLLFKSIEIRATQRLLPSATNWEISTERLSPFLQIATFWTVCTWVVIGHVSEFVIGHRNRETIPESFQIIQI